MINMCGLYGLYSQNIRTYHVDWFIELGLRSLARGTDSTGIAIVDRIPKTAKNKKVKFGVHWRKDIANAGLFFRYKKVKEDLAIKNKIILMGHNRHATIGTIGIEEAHPFSYEHIIGCHNGTIHDHDYKPNKDKVSDSDHLFERIAKDGLINTTQGIINGALALSYIDTKKERLYFVRNSKRPLYTVWDKKMTVFLWASEAEYLDDLTEGVAAKLEWGSIKALPIDTLFSIQYRDHTFTEEEVELEKPFVLGSASHGYSQHNHENSGDHYGKDAWKHETGGWTQQDSLAAKAAVAKRMRNIKQPFDGGSAAAARKKRVEEYKSTTNQLCLAAPVSKTEGKDTMITYFGEVQASLKVFEKLLNRGCCYCQSPKDIDDKVHWLCSSSYICETCISDPQVMYFLTEEELTAITSTEESTYGQRLLQ